MPAKQTPNVRNDMYLTSDMLARIAKSSELKFEAAEQADLKAYKAEIDGATKFIPTWVKVAVAIAPRMGTMIRWKRIVVTSAPPGVWPAIAAMPPIARTRPTSRAAQPVEARYTAMNGPKVVEHRR